MKIETPLTPEFVYSIIGKKVLLAPVGTGTVLGYSSRDLGKEGTLFFEVETKIHEVYFLVSYGHQIQTRIYNSKTRTAKKVVPYQKGCGRFRRVPV